MRLGVDEDIVFPFTAKISGGDCLITVADSFIESVLSSAENAFAFHGFGGVDDEILERRNSVSLFFCSSWRLTV